MTARASCIIRSGAPAKDLRVVSWAMPSTSGEISKFYHDRPGLGNDILRVHRWPTRLGEPAHSNTAALLTPTGSSGSTPGAGNAASTALSASMAGASRCPPLTATSRRCICIPYVETSSASIGSNRAAARARVRSLRQDKAVSADAMRHCLDPAHPGRPRCRAADIARRC